MARCLQLTCVYKHFQKGKKKCSKCLPVSQCPFVDCGRPDEAKGTGSAARAHRVWAGVSSLCNGHACQFYGGSEDKEARLLDTMNATGRPRALHEVNSREPGTETQLRFVYAVYRVPRQLRDNYKPSLCLCRLQGCPPFALPGATPEELSWATRKIHSHGQQLIS